MEYYKGALAACEWLGYEWKRDENGKHTLIKKWKFSVWKIPEGCIYEEGEFESRELAKKVGEMERKKYLEDNPEDDSDDYWVEVEVDE